MSTTDPILPKFYERKNYWILVQGRETFYDQERNLITFETEDGAIYYRDQFLVSKNKFQLGVKILNKKK